MEVTISSENENIMPCLQTTRAGEATTIPYHRHCQATVCSASGYRLAGLTWHVLNGNTAETVGSMGLENLQSLFKNTDNPPNVRQYFTRNELNITQDLRSILELIDKVAGMKAPFVINFKDLSGNLVQSKNINPWMDSPPEYTFTIGRTVSLSIDGNPISFHTLKQNSGEKLSVTLNKPALTISVNGDAVGSANVVMDSAKTIDITRDYNLIPAKDTGESVTPTKKYHIYKMTKSANFNINLYLSNYSSNTTDIISVEVHVKNTSGSEIKLNSVSCDKVTAGKMIPLTDQVKVYPGRTNVWVFRCHMTDNVNNNYCTYGLAYVYPR